MTKAQKRKKHRGGERKRKSERKMKKKKKRGKITRGAGRKKGTRRRRGGRGDEISPKGSLEGKKNTDKTRRKGRGGRGREKLDGVWGKIGKMVLPPVDDRPKSGSSTSGRQKVPKTTEDKWKECKVKQ